ncbi:DgyrCDS4216 [Dimorphilus gyrociliatus]|uniref:protein-tyrosine-phosphatase n=1 Tax=Dimorphilus gyrociliatus TaxID=2664684 RepID=A0A7I8VHR9_9ANNE|nr:DgyrCDS4216 [Dimorphilus gyrociliatus]
MCTHKSIPFSSFARCDVARRCFIKNRFQDVSPYDFNRVNLKPEDNTADTNYQASSICDTYINASFIEGYSTSKQYIACQGPMSDTFNDFWRMIWQYEISGIIMLNDLKDEGEGAGDYMYYPSKENESQAYGSYFVHLIKVIYYPESIVRLFKLSREDQTRNVRHFQFTKWADHSVPSNGRALLEFRERVNKMVVNFKRAPLVVHCRAGVGRTGTYICLEICLQQLAQTKQLDILKVVSSLRRQRVSMVQTPLQYRFLYLTILEELMAPKNTYDVKEFSFYTNQCFRKTSNGWIPYKEIVRQYQVLHICCANYPPTAYIKPSKTKMTKNPATPILEKRMVIVTKSLSMSGAPISTSAVYVDGHDSPERFIVTEAPNVSDPQSCNLFWKIIFYQECTHIIMLNSLREMDSIKPYWPTDNSSKVFDELRVTLIKESTVEKTIVVRDFEIDYATCRKVTQLACSVPSEVNEVNLRQVRNKIVLIYIALLSHVQKTNLATTIAVHCLDGVVRSGLFIAFTNIANKILEEDIVDVYYHVKLIRDSRPEFISSLVEYSLLYQMAEIIIKAKGQISLESIGNLLSKYDEQLIESNKGEKVQTPIPVKQHQQHMKTNSIT